MTNIHLILEIIVAKSRRKGNGQDPTQSNSISSLRHQNMTGTQTPMTASSRDKYSTAQVESQDDSSIPVEDYWGLMICLWSDPPGFNCWTSVAPAFQSWFAVGYSSCFISVMNLDLYVRCF